MIYFEYQNAVDCVKDICASDDVGKVTSLLQKWHRQGMAVTSNVSKNNRLIAVTSHISKNNTLRD